MFRGCPHCQERIETGNLGAPLRQHLRRTNLDGGPSKIDAAAVGVQRDERRRAQQRGRDGAADRAGGEALGGGRWSGGGGSVPCHLQGQAREEEVLLLVGLCLDY